ncbi:flagellar export chaperone FliS [Cohnella xylanilytica]|uniref:flagellar export chaperone FliS n=1 Tax=Cohnella xylanilytica TaxID=557555 RepID=UPI0027952FB3|nr:flagellar export chaperone FliS [Cohnella xylanilytica]
MNPYQIYRQSSVQTASPAQLVIMLYDGAVRFVKQSIEHMENRDIEGTHTCLIKAQSIVHELVASLNFDYPISKNLAQVYEYLLHLLITANVRKKKEPAEEALIHLTELREAWVQASKTNAKSQEQHG